MTDEKILKTISDLTDIPVENVRGMITSQVLNTIEINLHKKDFYTFTDASTDEVIWIDQIEIAVENIKDCFPGGKEARRFLKGIVDGQKTYLPGKKNVIVRYAAEQEIILCVLAYEGLLKELYNSL